jgi:hypothetical protein
MKSLLIFLIVQSMFYFPGSCNVITISLIVLGSAVVKDKRHRQKTVDASLEL